MDDIVKEAGLSPNWQVVEQPVIKPGEYQQAPPPPNAMADYFQGSISPTMQHDAVFVGTKYGTPRVPSISLMPVAVTGLPSVGSAIQSGTRVTITETSSTTAAGSIGQIQFNGGGPLAASASLSWNNVSDILTVLGAAIITGGVTITGSFILVGTGGAHQVLQQSSLNGAITVGQLSYSDISGTPPIISAIQFTIDGGGASPNTGVYGQISVPYNCTILGWTITADQSGSAVIDVLRSTYAAFPTTASIAGTDKPTLSSAQKNTDSTLTGWGSTALHLGDELQFNLNSVSTCQRLNLTIRISVP